MAVPWIVVVCRGSILCLVPLGLYLQALARRHRGPGTTVVGGRGDFLTLLAGLGGFLVAGLALLLGAIDADPRLLGRADFAGLDGVLARQRLLRVGSVLGYCGLVGLLALATLRRRARMLCIYRAERGAVEAAVAEALAAAGVPAERFGDAWSSDRPLVEARHASALLYTDLSVTAADPRLAQEIARQLGDALAKVPPSRHDASGPFAAAAWLAFFAAAVAFGLLAVYEFARRSQ